MRFVNLLSQSKFYLSASLIVISMLIPHLAKAVDSTNTTLPTINPIMQVLEARIGTLAGGNCYSIPINASQNNYETLFAACLVNFNGSGCTSRSQGYVQNLACREGFVLTGITSYSTVNQTPAGIGTGYINLGIVATCCPIYYQFANPQPCSVINPPPYCICPAGTVC